MQRGIQTRYLDPRSVASDLLESDTPRSAVSWRERKVQTIGHQTRNRRASEQELTYIFRCSLKYSPIDSQSNRALYSNGREHTK